MKVYIYSYPTTKCEILYEEEQSNHFSGLTFLGTCECEVSGRKSTYIKDEKKINVGDVVYVNRNVRKKKDKFLLINSINYIK